MDNFSFSNPSSLSGPSPAQSLSLSHSLEGSDFGSMNSSRFEERKALRRVREEELFNRM